MSNYMATKSPSVAGRLAIDEALSLVPEDATFDAQEFLDNHPEFAGQKSAILDIVYEEFCRRREMGQEVDPRQLAARFPTIARSFLRLVEVDLFLNQESGTPLTAGANWPDIGQSWLEFQLLEELGRGAFSRVYLARDQTLGGRLAVIKATPLGTWEAETLGRLGHAHIMPVYSVRRDEQRGLTALCMPFLSRVTLLNVIDEFFSAAPAKPAGAGRLRQIVQQWNQTRDVHAPDEDSTMSRLIGGTHLDEVLSIGVQLAEAVGFAHRMGVLHLDIKPSNILLTNSGRAVLLDFNLSRSAETDLPFVGGTLPYMAPEQLTALLSPEPSAREIDPRADVFSLGATLFEFATGAAPFGELPLQAPYQSTAKELLSRQRNGVMATAALDRRVAEMFAHCLHFDRAQRPQTMDELRRLLVSQLSLKNRTARWLRSHRRLANAAGAALVAAGLSIAGGLWFRDPLSVREYQAGRQAYSRGDDAAAVEHISAALKADPDLPAARMVRACAYLRQKNLVGAYTDFEALAPVVPNGRATAGLAHVGAELQMDFPGAALRYKRAVDEGYTTAIAYNNLGFCLNKAGRSAEAAEALHQSRALDPNLAAVYHNLARNEISLANRQKRSPDTSYIEEALQRGPETAELYMDGATILAISSRWAGEADQQAILDRIFTLLARAADLGIAPAHLDNMARLDARLESDARWTGLTARVRPGGQLSRAVLLLDPVAELMDADIWRSSPASER
jgi:serine/threonine protein kinase/Tfp pilus assembly protein PilF